ncbi:SMC domain protein [Pyrobaculum islandicum DSM 4184]|uniref:SMC domain protein n=1 Tax=Pyrobaculum islandicum (strain DSM 4184 / JCM 9189 / GEO3) TaxID=384616 RepID=A1RSX8_PYRIL|nr:SMC family ATPase [Pyrobaculum islandicum]ABL88060.1 SMC domain protein [Pyrobaculum islandicum DSM 4184]
MWRIEKIELENFRSYKGRHEVSLGDVTILLGRIGAGKTSLLYAIEYALFGKQLEVRERVAKLVDLINVDAQEANVALELRRGNDKLRIERRLGRRGSEKLVVLYNGIKLRDRDAEERLVELIGADEDIYERLVYISHRTLEGFIYGTAQKRTLSVDRLFGIDIIDNILRVVSSIEKYLLEKAENLRKRLSTYEKYRDIIKKYGGYKGVVTRLETIEGELAALKEREVNLTKTVEELAKRRAGYLEKIRENENILLEYYKTRSELEILESTTGEDVGLDAVEKIRDALQEALEEYEHILGHELLEKLTTRDLESLSAAMVEAYEALVRLSKDLESQISEVRKTYEQYLARVKKLEDEIKEVETKLRRLERSYIRFKELQKSFQSLETAKAALNELKRRLEETEKSMAYISALKTVSLYIAEIGVNRCPICGSPISREVALNIAREVESKFGELIHEVENLKERIREYEKAVDEMEILSGEVAEYLSTKNRLEELKLEREEIIKKMIQAEKALKQLERRVEKLHSLITRVDKRTILDALSKYGKMLRVRELKRRLKELEEMLNKAGVVREILDVEMRWREITEELERTSSRLAELYREKAVLEEIVREVGGDAENLKKALDNTLYAYSKLQEVKAKFELVKVNARARLVEIAKSRFNEVFLTLYRYGDISKVNVDLEQRKGYYDFYAISPTGERYGISKLSDGQRLSIALALALALREISNIQIGFIIFDEPIPYVDVNIRRAFAELVRSLSSRYQIVVATQSGDFADVIKDAVPNARLYMVTKEESSRVAE